MDVVKEEPGKDDTENKDANKSMDEDKQGGEKKKEPNTTTLSNPARCFLLSSMHALRMASLQGASRSKKVHHDACRLQVGWFRLRCCQVADIVDRYEPVSKKLWGIVMLRDLKPDEKAEIVEVTIPATALPPKEEEEPPPPEPFEYTD